MFKKLFASLVIVALSFVGLVAVATPAQATGSSDSSLAELLVRGEGDPWTSTFEFTTAMTSLRPGQDFYDVYSVNQAFRIYARPSDPDATISVSGGDASNLALTANSDPGYSSLLRGRLTVAEASDQIVRLTVTAADGVTTKVTTLKVSSGTKIAQPRLISSNVTAFSTAGGTKGVLFVENWTPCSRTTLSYKYQDVNGVTQTQNDVIYGNYLNTDSSGISKISYTSSSPFRTFRDDTLRGSLTLANDTVASNCVFDYFGWRNTLSATARATFPGLIEYFNPAVTSTTIPDTVSQDTFFVVNGPGISSSSTLSYQLYNPATGSSAGIDARHINNNSVQFSVSPGNFDAEWKRDQNLEFVVTQHGDEGVDPYPDPVVLFRKKVKFTPEMATGVSVSPAKGPTKGGNKVTITGHGICNAYGWPATVKIGGVDVYNFTVTNCDFNSSSNKIALDGVASATFIAPPGPAGQADITVDMGYGPTTLSQKYIYGATPEVSLISPSTVANTGGSIVTLTGTNFGASGTPVVIIDGRKSPLVNRLSPTKVRAMVPQSTSVGPVSVDIVSSSGGGGLSQLASLTYVTRSADPVVTNLSTVSGVLSGGNTLVISGSAFSAAASGVTFDGRAARVVSATSSSLTVEVPAGRSTGSIAVSVATPTGLTTVANGYSYLADPGVSSVSPSTIPSTATGNAAKVTITGAGFGASGKITIGSAGAVDYTASAGGTVISGIDIPTSVAGLVAISISPAGSTKPFTTSIRITAPKITYFGPQNGGFVNDEGLYIFFGDNDPWVGGQAGIPLSAGNNGGDVMLITGSGFGSSGQIRIGSTLVQPLTYGDTQITFISPSGLVPGTYDLRVAPTSGTLSGYIPRAVTVGYQLATPAITSVEANSQPSNNVPLNHFWPNSTDSNLYTVTGVGFNGSDSGATTKVYMQGFSNFWSGAEAWNLLEVVSKSDTSIVVRIPRDLELLQWNALQVVTNRTTMTLSTAIYYDGTQPPPISGGSQNQSPGSTLNQSSFFGLCNDSPIGSRNPAVVTFTNDFGAFGSGGVVYVGAVAINPADIVWAGDGSSVTLDFGNQSDIQDVWGAQIIKLASVDNDVRYFNFSCSVESTVTTTVNGEDSSLTVNAGTPLVASSTLNNALPGTAWTEPASNYEYQTAASRAVNGAYLPGLPNSAGDFYIRARIPGAAYDRAKYASITQANSVHVVIVGQAVTITPRLVGGGSTLVYKGQLGDGSNGTSTDIGYTVSPTPSDPITSVIYQYRNHACTAGAWNTGLPKDVAIIPYGCGGNGTDVGSWDIRVGSFEMAASGVNKAGHYIPQRGVFNLTITKAPLTLSSVRAEKTYDGLTSVTVGEITVSGAVEGERPTVDPSFAQSVAFADPVAGVNKQVTAGGPIVLHSLFAKNYAITNPNLAMVGTISKSDNVLRIEPSLTSVVLGQTATVDLVVTSIDVLTGQAPIADAQINAPELVSATPMICSIIGTVITPLAAGDCVIQATQAASDNYNAGVSYHKSPSLIETVKIKVYASAMSVSVIADDMKVSVGTSVGPSYTTTGLLNNDTFDGTLFDYYQGSTLLNSAPSAIGTYRIVPRDGAVVTSTPVAYSSNVRYIAGTLVITAAPPVITSIAPGFGPEAGGNTVIITGTGFGSLTSITLGERVLRKPAFTVNGDGTQVSFVAPPGTGGLDVLLNAGEAEASTTYGYITPFIPVRRVQDNGGVAIPPVVTAIAPAQGPDTGGNTVVITGTGLEALTSIVIGTNPIDSSSIMVNRAGTQATFIAPAGTGIQDLTLVAGLLETTMTYSYYPAPVLTGGGASAPVITSITPAHGPETGGNTVVISGKGFGALTSITLGAVTLGASAFSINGDGTKVSLVMPKGTGTLKISLWVGQLYSETIYTYEAAIDGGGDKPSHLVLMLDLVVGAKFVGQRVAINGGGLAPSSTFSLVLRSNPIVLIKGVTDAQGGFDRKLVIPAKACLPAGKHSMELRGVTPNGKKATQTAYFSLLENCNVGGTVAKTAAKQQTLTGFLFAFRSSVLTKDAKRSLDHLVGFIKGAKSINIFGYTETDTKSAAVKVANFKLAAARALAVKAYLQSKGIVAKWVTIGKGGSNPVSVIDQFRNRRVEIQANF